MIDARETHTRNSHEKLIRETHTRNLHEIEQALFDVRNILLQVSMTHVQVSRALHEFTRRSFSYDFLVRVSWA